MTHVVRPEKKKNLNIVYGCSFSSGMVNKVVDEKVYVGL